MSGLSIEHRLPLIIGILLLGVILVISTAAYVEMRRTSLESAAARLVISTNQFRDFVQQSTAQVRAQTAAMANAPVLVRFARTRDPALRDSARAALNPPGPPSAQYIVSELRDGMGVVLLSTAAADTGFDTVSATEMTRFTARDSVIVGRYRRTRDTLVYPVTARVPDANGAYALQWRRSTGSRAREQISRLVGSDATLFLGNADFSEWTDLERPSAVPALDRSALGAPQEYVRAGGGRYLITTAPIAGTPWLVAFEIPLSTVFAPINAFLRRIALIAIAALAVSLLAAWMASRRITGPLSELTRAADAIALGQRAEGVHVDRSDELGTLGRAFATMAGEVHHARLELERKVDERTRDLHVTMQQLHDAQDSLVRREKLAMLGQLASGVGHELRNPLGVMTNALYYLKVVLASSPQNVLEYLDILQQQITLSEKIVGDLLDFARLRQPQREPASVAQVAHAQVARLGVTTGVRLDVHIPSDLPAVLVDQVQLGQIILNLLTNAVQAIDGAGNVTVRAEVAGDRVHLDVTDTGPGVPPENLEKIFEPLFTTKARGIGLGLAVSRSLARANGGEITLSSPPGKGATFRLTLEVARGTSA